MKRVIVLGTGPAGLTAALYLARANMEPLVIEGMEPGGQLTTTTDVENFPGFPAGITGPELMQNMREQAERFGARFQVGKVTHVDLDKPPFKLYVDKTKVLTCDALILATGAAAKWLEIPGEKEYMGQGISTCATCDGFFFRGKSVIVVGGGDSAMEEANFLTNFATEVKLVHRRDELRASKIMQDRARANEKISWHLDRRPVSVSKEKDKFNLVVYNNKSKKEEIITADGIFAAIGHTPNTSFLDKQLELDDLGYVKVAPGTTKSSVPGLFACGDVQDRVYRQAITAAGTGCMAALDCQHYLDSLSAPRTQAASIDK